MRPQDFEYNQKRESNGKKRTQIRCFKEGENIKKKEVDVLVAFESLRLLVGGEHTASKNRGRLGAGMLLFLNSFIYLHMYVCTMSLCLSVQLDDVLF